MRQLLAIVTALMVLGSPLLTTGPSLAQSKGEIVIGVQCDRTGATQIVGTVLCPGFHDYIALINSTPDGAARAYDPRYGQGDLFEPGRRAYVTVKFIF